ncbi:hypothetical protein Lumi_116 [Xylophilus phage Lumi]|nr:hypothetical protein Lumi_001 [Xylophilus phage Lumi]WCD44255.1 hypothetical protein Lumi_116 [Xylophilus phage Lumi]
MVIVIRKLSLRRVLVEYRFSTGAVLHNDEVFKSVNQAIRCA